MHIIRKRGVRGRREDRISFLPDHLLCQILSVLPTKNAVSTSVLSKRWKSVWLSVPLLDLDTFEFPGYYDFVSFVDGFLDISRESCIHKLKLVFSRQQDGLSNMTQWIRNAVMRKVQHLDIFCRWSHLVAELMPLRLYTCETLVYLKLRYVSMADFEYVSLPRLKIMHLEDNNYTTDALLERLISYCPVLEDLIVVRNVAVEVENTVKVLRVRSESLNSLKLVLNGGEYGDSEDTGDWEVVIDAPGLNYLSLKDNRSRSFVISNLNLSAKVDIDVNFDVVDISAANDSSRKKAVRKFLTGLSRVRDMTISGTSLKIICHYLKHEPLPQFPYMTQLNVNSYNYDSKKLPNFLESCPNLRSFVLELKEYKENEQIILTSSSVPKCLRSSLEYIELKRPISGGGEEMKLVKYFLENSVVLKKFTLRLGSFRRMYEESIILMELLRFKRCSASCEVVVQLEETYPNVLYRFF